MKNKNKKTDNTISSWLKRLFSISTFTLIAGIIATIYAGLSYIHGRPGLLRTYVYKDYFNYKIDNLAFLFCADEYVVDMDDVPIVKFVNVKENAIPNLKVEVEVGSFTDLTVSSDYEIVGINEDDTYNLVYKKNYLEGQNTLPFPISDFDDSESESGLIYLRYNIFHDGLKKPIEFTYCIYIADEIDDELTNSFYDMIYLGARVSNPEIGVIINDTLMTNPSNIQYFNTKNKTIERKCLFDMGKSIIIDSDNSDEISDYSFFGSLKKIL